MRITEGAAASSGDGGGVVGMLSDELPSLAITDEALVGRLQNGDTDAAEALVRRHQASLLRYLHRLGGSAHAAEELAQQTWLSVLEHVGQFRPEQTGALGFRPWLFRIATNKANDLWRSRGRQKKLADGLSMVVESSQDDATSGVDHAEQHERVRRAVDQLPEPQRQVVLLRYFSDLKFVEIAQVVGCPLNTALGRMHKALIKLKKELGNE